jgi:hypothetical protein
VAVPDKKEVAKKMRSFGASRFGTMKEFAEALGMNPVTLHSGYLNSRSLPGPVLLVKLMHLGCDIHWLLAGDERAMPAAGNFTLPKKTVHSSM